MSEYRIDDLARAAGTTVRNVRVYQDRGLLPPPRKQGRTGYYSEVHLERLRLIGRLLERGYTFATIGELLAAWAQGWQVEDVLGLERAVTAPWTDERPESVSLMELRRDFGKQATKKAIQRVVELGLVVRHGTSFRVPSPRLLAAGKDLVAAGIPLPAVLDVAEGLQHDMADVAKRFVDLVAQHVLPEGDTPTPTSEQVGEIAALIEQLRPHAQRAVDAAFAIAMQRALGQAVERAAGRLGDHANDSRTG